MEIPGNLPSKTSAEANSGAPRTSSSLRWIEVRTPRGVRPISRGKILLFSPLSFGMLNGRAGSTTVDFECLSKLSPLERAEVQVFFERLAYWVYQSTYRESCFYGQEIPELDKMTDHLSSLGLSVFGTLCRPLEGSDDIALARIFRSTDLRIIVHALSDGEGNVAPKRNGGFLVKRWRDIIRKCLKAGSH